MNESDKIFVKNKQIFLETAEYGKWSLSISDIILIGEYTNEEGPFLEDHFLVLLTSFGEIFESPVGVLGFNEMLDHLSSLLGYEISLDLYLHTTFKSRIVFPYSMRDVKLFDISPNNVDQKNFFGKISRVFKMSTYTMELSREVKEYIQTGRKRDSKGTLLA